MGENVELGRPTKYLASAAKNDVLVKTMAILALDFAEKLGNSLKSTQPLEMRQN
jgi:hypothetical protein